MTMPVTTLFHAMPFVGLDANLDTIYIFNAAGPPVPTAARHVVAVRSRALPLAALLGTVLMAGLDAHECAIVIWNAARTGLRRATLDRIADRSLALPIPTLVKAMRLVSLDAHECAIVIWNAARTGLRRATLDRIAGRSLALPIPTLVKAMRLVSLDAVELPVGLDATGPNLVGDARHPLAIRVAPKEDAINFFALFMRHHFTFLADTTRTNWCITRVCIRSQHQNRQNQ
ncbi:MAG TPA: hypothetical protein QF800_05715 [Phycisphaerales bacterium]|nr:hypothetical protein [Phycisphaerales bacterium]